MAKTIRSISVLSLVFGLAIVTAPAHSAETASPGIAKAPLAGVGGGAVIGTVVGGPIGLVVGSAIGALIGGSMQREQQMHATRNKLADARHRVALLSGELAAAKKDYADLARRSVAVNARATALNSAQIPGGQREVCSEDVLFRTASGKLEPLATQRIKHLAAMIKSEPRLRIRLSGYADRRGGASENMTLSRKRAENVKRELMEAGIPANRISAKWYGDTKAKAKIGDTAGLTMDRRVTVELTTAPRRDMQASTDTPAR